MSLTQAAVCLCALDLFLAFGTAAGGLLLCIIAVIAFVLVLIDSPFIASRR